MTLSETPLLWSKLYLEDVLSLIRNGTSQIQNQAGLGIPVTRIETISNGIVDPNKVGWLEIYDQDFSEYMLHPGDILFSHINSPEHLGKCAIYEGTPQILLHGMNLLLLRCNPEIINPYYLLYYLRSRSALHEIRKRSGQAVNQSSINQKALQKVPLLLPPLPEQNKIADILRQADVLRELRQNTNEKIKFLLGSIFFEIFGDPITTKNDWAEKSLGDVLDIDASLVDPRRDDLSNLPKVGSDNIESYTGKLIRLQSALEMGIISGNFLFSEENILYSKIRPALRKVATPDFVGLCSADIYPIVFDKSKVSKHFLAQLLRSDHFTAYTTRVSGRAQIPKINRADLFRYRTRIPDLETQYEFERRAVAVLEHQKAIDQSQLTLYHLYQSISSSAFDGMLTYSWREKRQVELQRAAVERDKVLGLRGETARLIDFKEGRVTPEELEVLRNALGNFAVNLASLHSEMFGGIGKPFEEITKSMTQSLVSMSQNLITPFLESVRQSLQNFKLALPVPPDEEEINSQIDLLPLPQEKRAIHDVLDATCLRVLKLAHASPAYFTPDDLTFGGITSTHTSASLRVLDSLGFVRLVEIDGVLRYHLINANTDSALKPDQIQQ